MDGHIFSKNHIFILIGRSRSSYSPVALLQRLQAVTDYVQALHAKEWVILLSLKWRSVTMRSPKANFSARLVLGSIPQPEARPETPQRVCVRSRQQLRRSHAEISPCIP